VEQVTSRQAAFGPALLRVPACPTLVEGLLVALLTEQLSEVLPWHILRGFAMLFPDPLVPKLSDSVRQQDGSLISMEWRRELPDAEAPTERSFSE
jgi:hypothetical protein